MTTQNPIPYSFRSVLLLLFVGFITGYGVGSILTSDTLKLSRDIFELLHRLQGMRSLSSFGLILIFLGVNGAIFIILHHQQYPPVFKTAVLGLPAFYTLSYLVRNIVGIQTEVSASFFTILLILYLTTLIFILLMKVKKGPCQKPTNSFLVTVTVVNSALVILIFSISSLVRNSHHSRVTTMVNDVRMIGSAAEQYAIENSLKPHQTVSFDQLVQANYFKAGSKISLGQLPISVPNQITYGTFLSQIEPGKKLTVPIFIRILAAPRIMPDDRRWEN